MSKTLWLALESGSMKNKNTTGVADPSAPDLVAANDEALSAQRPAGIRPKSSRAAWDPYDVWSTRVRARVRPPSTTTKA